MREFAGRLVSRETADPWAVMRVTVLYPDRLNLYADRGNLLVLAERCRRRGIAFETTAVDIGDADGLPDGDLVYIGGGQDSDQRACAVDLARRRDAIAAAATGGAVVLGVCGGYQLLGHEYHTPDGTIAGIGLLDVVTVRGAGSRLVGNVVVEVDSSVSLLGGSRQRLVGFENHQGVSELGPRSRSLGVVLAGSGNNGRDRSEGAVSGSVIGTYLHGPLLAKNVWLADRLIEHSVGAALPALEDRFADLVHRRAVDVALTDTP